MWPVLLWVFLLGSLATAARDAQTLARRVEARYHSATTLQAVFLERYSEGRNALRAESGKVYFSRPGRMRWEYESPEEKLFVADGKHVWFYVPADRTVTRSPVKQSADWRTPLALLTGPPGRAKLSRLCGRVELAEAGPVSPGRPAGVDVPRAATGHAVLRCLPRGEARGLPPAGSTGLSATDSTPFSPDADSFLEVLLEVDVESGELASVLVRQAGGIEIEYRFANWQRNVPLPEAMFHFHATPVVAIVDASSLAPPAR